jgi:hypothetical protein
VKRYAPLVASLACMLLGCPAARDQMPLVGAPPTAFELPLLQHPPVSAKCELLPLPSYQKERRYLAFDLNGDGVPEYFVEDNAGANSICFALVDSAGKLLTRTSDVGEVGSGRILVLRSRHHGYHDILCSHCDPGGVSGFRWEFDGKRYVKARAFAYEGADTPKAYVERVRGAVIACWYMDMFEKPRPETSN